MATNGEARTVDDGTEIDSEASVKVTRYIPGEKVDRMHMTAVHADWSEKALGVKGTIYVPMGSADVIVTVRRVRGKKPDEQFTFSAQSMILAAVRAFLGGTCPTCGDPAEVVDKAPAGESGDIVRCATCDKTKAA